MCELCFEKSNEIIDSSWYRADGAIKSNAPDNIKLGNFLKRILPITGDRYCFIRNTIIKSREKLEVICSIHGSFFMTQAHLLEGKNCPKCSGKHRYTTEEFIAECKNKYQDRFDYSNTVYTTAHSYISVKCNICSSGFKTKAYTHLQKGSCLTCSGLRNKTTEEFIEASKSKFGDWFTYNNTKYINNKTKVSIYCKEHGEIFVIPDVHLASKYGCIHCSGLARKSLSDFISQAYEIHGDNYSYDLVDYLNTNTKVKFQCNTCDSIVEQTPHSHLAGLSTCSCYTNKNLENTLVYVLKSDDIYKIGITNNIIRRLKRLNTTKDMDFKCILQSPILGFQKSHKLEQLLHKHFKDKQCKDFLDTDLAGKTELFNLDEEDIQFIDEYIKDYCKINNLVLG